MSSVLHDEYLNDKLEQVFRIAQCCCNTNTKQEIQCYTNSQLWECSVFTHGKFKQLNFFPVKIVNVTLSYLLDIDECAENPRICGAHSICNNHPGTFRCECVDGFQFGADGRTCIRKCSKQFASLRVCVFYKQLQENQPLFQEARQEVACSFPSQQRVCVFSVVEVHHDINHCQRGTHACDIAERARCSYTGGSTYTCSCLPGFTGDGSSCHGGLTAVWLTAVCSMFVIKFNFNNWLI